MVICTWAPGKNGRCSLKGTSSSHAGTIASRAVPLRIEILPSHLSRNGLMLANPWPAPGIAEPADVLDQRRLERGSVAPPLAEALGVRALERPPEPDSGVAHRDHRHSSTQPATEGIRLYRDPATCAGVFNNILACLRKRHTEPAGGLRSRPSSPGGSEPPLGDPVDHLVHVLLARTGVTSSSASEGPEAAALGTLPCSSNRSSA